MQFSILSDPANLKTARKNLANFIHQNQIKLKDEGNVILAVDEAVQNVIRYAYGMDTKQPIDFEFQYNNHDLVIKIRDYGKQVPLENIKSRELEDVKPGGLGVYFIKSISKSLQFEHQDKGTLLTLVF